MKYALHSKEILEILKSVLPTDHITGLSHSRIFPDGSRAELWSNFTALENTYIKTNYTTRTHAPRLYAPNERYIFLFDKIKEFDDKTKENYEKHMAEQKELFNLDNTLLIRGKDKLCDEFFCFYGPAGGFLTKNFFLNNLPWLESFIKEYKTKAKALIKLAEENRIVKPWIDQENRIVVLTKREKEIAQLLTYDFTSKEIAKKLNIHSRTVEGYLEKIKDKYRCYKKSELTNLLRKDAYLFSDEVV